MLFMVRSNIMNGKIMIVDDEEAIARLIAHNLNKEGFVTTVLNRGDGVLPAVDQADPDLIILDLMLPGRNGLEICRDLRRQKIDIPVIMLTARYEEGYCIMGLEAGADDYLTKPFSVRELVARVKAVIRRRPQYFGNDVDDIYSGEFIVKPSKYEIHFKGIRLDLTLKEYELLLVFIRNRGRVLKRDYLWQTLWDYSESVNTRVIDIHVSRLRDKIDDDSASPQYIKTVRGVGYKLEE